jgi:hypothetical protein
MTESAQAARDNQKSLCFVCEKMIPNDSSKRRLHIGRHIIKSIRNVAETQIPINPVGCANVQTSFVILTCLCVGPCVSMRDMRQINIARKLRCDVDQSWQRLQDCFYLSRVHWHCIHLGSQRFENNAVHKRACHLRAMCPVHQFQNNPCHLAI